MTNDKAKSIADRSRALRYKRPALDSMGYDDMIRELWDIQEACTDVQWYIDQDGDTLLAAMDGNEDEMWEFKMAFSDLVAKTDTVLNLLGDYVVRDEYDDCTVALVGNRYKMLGFDGYEEDYYALTRYENELARTEAGKRLMRHTKAEMISIIGQSLGALIAFLDLRQQYDYLKATMDILRDENMGVLRVVKEIENAYDAAYADNFVYGDATKALDALVRELPERLWIE